MTLFVGIFLIVAVGVIASQALIWKKVAASGDRRAVTWKDMNDGIGTWTSVIGTLAAILFSGYSIHHANTLFYRQQALEQRRAEDLALREARRAMPDLYSEAQIFVSTWLRYKAEVQRDPNIERDIRADFVRAWTQFDRRINDAILRSRTHAAKDDALVKSLQEVYDKSANMYDILMDGAMPYLSESAFTAAPSAREMTAAVAAAEKLIDNRLDVMYRDLNE